MLRRSVVEVRSHGCRLSITSPSAFASSTVRSAASASMSQPTTRAPCLANSRAQTLADARSAAGHNGHLSLQTFTHLEPSGDIGTLKILVGQNSGLHSCRLVVPQSTTE